VVKTDDEFYRIPLTSGEALGVLAALRALKEFLTENDSTIVSEIDPGILDSAAERVASELPEFTQDRAERLANGLLQALRNAGSLADVFGDTLNAGGSDTGEPPFPIGRTRRLLEDALEQNQPAEIEYFVTSRNEWTTRCVDVVEVRAIDGTWYLSGQCRLRNDYRQFRLDHIRAVRILDDEGRGRGPDLFDDEPGAEKGSGEQSGAFDRREHRVRRQQRRR